ncbi:MAG: TIGR03435 family protein [Acidobacteriaceae bacterium]
MIARPIFVASAFLLVPVALAQAPIAPTAKPISFDVVSVRPNNTGSHAMLDRTPPDGYSVENYTVRIIIGDAFGIRDDLVSGGPGWIDSDHYDLTAKIAGDDMAAYKAVSRNQRNQMLQAVLADRFHLVAHSVEKELPGYTLTVAKSGPKLVEAEPNQRPSYGANVGDYHCQAVSIATLAKLLSRHLQQTVVDETGLTGKYSFELKWATDRPGPARPDAESGAEASTPSGLPELPTALGEELGLKLTPTKLPTTTLVIDSIERPSPN